MVPTIPIIHTTMIILKKGVPHGILEDGEDDYMFWLTVIIVLYNYYEWKEIKIKEWLGLQNAEIDEPIFHRAKSARGTQKVYQ